MCKKRFPYRDTETSTLNPKAIRVPLKETFKAFGFPKGSLKKNLYSYKTAKSRCVRDGKPLHTERQSQNPSLPNLHPASLTAPRLPEKAVSRKSGATDPDAWKNSADTYRKRLKDFKLFDANILGPRLARREADTAICCRRWRARPTEP